MPPWLRRVWLVSRIPPPGGSAVGRRRVAQALGQAADAERWGLDAIWLAEIHQQATRSVLSAPLMSPPRSPHAGLGSRSAARFRCCRCHPLRLAEETATIDQMSHGRLLLGAGRSGNVRGYAAYGVPYSESRERVTETLDILGLAWTQPSFSFQGQSTVRRSASVPRPYRRPHPPIRIAAASEDTFPGLGALGYPLFVAVRSGSLSGLRRIKAYRDAYAAAGHPGKGEVICVCHCISLTPMRRRGRKRAERDAGIQVIDHAMEGSPSSRRRPELETVRTITRRGAAGQGRGRQPGAGHRSAAATAR